jgi:hypothetical protein
VGSKNLLWNGLIVELDLELKRSACLWKMLLVQTVEEKVNTELGNHFSQKRLVEL